MGLGTRASNASTVSERGDPLGPGNPLDHPRSASQSRHMMAPVRAGLISLHSGHTGFCAG